MNDARIQIGAEAIDDLLVMLGVDPKERPEHGGSSIAEVLARAVLRSVGELIDSPHVALNLYVRMKEERDLFRAQLEDRDHRAPVEVADTSSEDEVSELSVVLSRADIGYTCREDYNRMARAVLAHRAARTSECPQCHTTGQHKMDCTDPSARRERATARTSGEAL